MTKSGRLLHTDWSKYDAQYVVFRPRLMSPATLQIEAFRAMGRFYSWRYILGHLARLDFHYAAIGIFGKTAIHKSLKVSSAYLYDLHFNAGGLPYHGPFQFHLPTERPGDESTG
jgi:hypothetical protein